MPESSPNSPPDTAAPPDRGPWATLACTLPNEAVVATLAKLSKAGKLPGYAPAASPGAGLASFAAFGDPLDYDVLVRRGADGQLTFEANLQRRMPLIALVLTIFAIWPGSWLTDSMLRSYFSWYDFNTYLWYIPLTVLPLPWVARSWMRKSRKAAYQHLRDVLPRIANALQEAQAPR